MSTAGMAEHPTAEPATARPDVPSGGYWRSRRGLAGWMVVCLVGALTAGVAVGMALPAPAAPPTLVVPAPGSVEVGFAQDMILHHLQAVEMADVVVRDSTDPQVRVLAYDIFTGQTAQVGQMQGWLVLWGRSQTSAGPRMAWMPPPAHQGAGMDHRTVMGAPAPMAGMATAQELAALRSAPSGPQRDGLFLQLMLRHHQGGAAMLEVAAAEAANPVVANFAGQMAGLQQHETDVMTGMMADRGVQPLPFPT